MCEQMIMHGVNNIKFNYRIILKIAKDRDRWRAVVNAVMNLQVP